MAMSDAAKTCEPGADQAIERAAAGERVVLRRAGAEFVAVVPLEDLRRLEKLEAEEDRVDVEDAERIMAAALANGEAPVAWEQVKRELGL